jgi:hypothetical protein
LEPGGGFKGRGVGIVIGGDTIVLAEPGDLEVLGAHTLEALGLTVELKARMKHG